MKTSKANGGCVELWPIPHWLCNCRLVLDGDDLECSTTEIMLKARLHVISDDILPDVFGHVEADAVCIQDVAPILQNGELLQVVYCDDVVAPFVLRKRGWRVCIIPSTISEIEVAESVVMESVAIFVGAFIQTPHHVSA